MSRKWFIGAALVAMLALPAFAGAHENDKTVMGTVSSTDGKNLMVKMADGKTIMVMMDAKTKVTQGKTKLELSAIKVGDRVVAAGPEEKEMIMAETVKLGAATAPPAAKSAAPAKPAAKK
jgi:hypothetical protein